MVKLTSRVRIQAQVAIGKPARPTDAPKTFTFDAVYDETTQQKSFYEESCYDLVEGVMEGYNGTIFAYGQVNPRAVLQFVLLVLVAAAIHAYTPRARSIRGNEKTR